LIITYPPRQLQSGGGKHCTFGRNLLIVIHHSNSSFLPLRRILSVMDAVFDAINAELQQENEVRSEVKDIVKILDENNRKANGICQQVHANWKKVAEIVAKAKELLQAQQVQYTKLADKAKGENRFKFSNLWKNVAQKDVFLFTFTTWLEKGKLATLEEVQQSVFGKTGVPLELENYLVGVTFLTPELARLCVNSVIAGDYEQPKKIADFVNDLYNGYQLLNLKNDFLRKRFIA